MKRPRIALGGLAAIVGMSMIASAAAEVPSRTQGGQTLVVPDAEMDLGDVYYFTPGEDAQAMCVSDAPLQRVAAISRRVVGYAVVPVDRPAGSPVLLAGACRAPAVSFDTGAAALNDFLCGAGMLDAANHPEITFELTATRDCVKTSGAGEPETYTMTLVGRLSALGKTLEIECPARLSLMPFTWQTMARYPGDLLTLRTRIEIPLADLGIQPPREWTGKIAERVGVDIFLLGNTVTPEKTLDPAVRQAELIATLQALTRVRDFADAAQGYTLLRELAAKNWDDPAVLNRLAAAVVAEDGLRRRDLALASALASRACALHPKPDPATLDTLARVHYERGDLASAVETQQKALDAAADSPPPAQAPLKASLEKYKAELSAAQAARLPSF